ncbi:MAG TPA: phosphatidylglycerol lysyltransferase domain-containing protein [Acidimicrobiales bacterium]|nr:phosphatidylglycerol lysyltransferase domain-containing protein [Acidimicrobiales bacterium]
MPADAPSPPAELAIDVPVGGRVLVAADLRLGRDPSAPMVAAELDLVRAIESATGPGVVVIAGNLFGADGQPPIGDGAAVLAAHPRLVGALAAFAAGPGRQVVVLPGDLDRQLAWSPAAARVVTRELGAQIALTVELRVATGAGERRVRVEPGTAHDPLARMADPTNPHESPLAHHLRGEVLPGIQGDAGPSGSDGDAAGRRRTGWLAGVEHLDDPAAFPRFIASRLAYRRLGRGAWLLVVPVAVAAVLRVPALSEAGESWRVALAVAAVVVELLLLAGLAAVALRGAYRALGAITLGASGRDPNAAARTAARALVAGGHRGLVTGHTCRPELTNLGTGFYANVGCVAEVVSEVVARAPGLGLPPVFLGSRQVSWVELEAGNELHVRLLHARVDLPGASLLERLAARRSEATAAADDLAPALVATFPGQASWPAPDQPLPGRRRTRRIAAGVVALAGFATLMSSLSDPLAARLRVLRSVLPLAVPQAADAIDAVLGLALLVIARGVRRGQRRAWVACQALLLGAAVLHLVKGVDVEEAVVAVVVAAYLYLQRQHFDAASEAPTVRGAAGTLVGAVVVVVAAGTLGAELGSMAYTSHHHLPNRLGWWQALQATVDRMVGLRGVALPHRIDEFFTPAMTATAAALALGLIVVLFRPVVARAGAARAGGGRGRGTHRTTGVGRPGFLGRRPPGDRGEAVTGSAGSGLDRARAVVARHGSGTLDWFALRPDKDFFFWGDTVVAYAVYGTVCLVSPDPIGPVAERDEAWRAFRAFVDDHGWALGGLGAGEEWLPVYRATGMHDLYVGDEAVVRVQRFSLDGGRFKGLRQAVNRVAKYGYTISFHDPSAISAELRCALEAVMTKSRRGDVERGFSMTLGRVFDPADDGLLLAVVHGPRPDGAPEGEPGPPVAFCHYVPAPGIGGYSLDLMRRDAGEHPNGLIDFAVVETIRWLREQGHAGLGLNFATMRAVLAGEAGQGVGQRVQAWLLRRMGDSMQIESLWRFNAKFDPDWQPRYAIYDAPENALAVAIAVARAESFWELPVIGRWLTPSAARGQEVAASAAEG